MIETFIYIVTRLKYLKPEQEAATADVQDDEKQHNDIVSVQD